VLPVYEAAGEAIARARRGEWPSLVECKTYCYFGHYSGDPGGYRTEEEINEAKRRDCILGLRTRLIERETATAAELDAIDAQAKQAVKDADDFAKSSPDPGLDTVLTDVYVSYP